MLTIKDKQGQYHTGQIQLPLYVSHLEDNIYWFNTYISRCQLTNAKEELEEIIEVMPEILAELKEKLDKTIAEEAENQ